MSRTWCTTLEESIVSEYVDSIINKQKKTRPPKSPYSCSVRPHSAAGRPHRPPAGTRPPSAGRRSSGSTRPASAAANVSDRPKTGCNVRNSSVKGERRRSYTDKQRGKSPSRSGSVESISSLNTSQLSVYSAKLEGPDGQYRTTTKKLIKRVKVFKSSDHFKFVVASSYTNLLEQVHEHHLYTSDSTALTPNLYPVLPHNCHLFSYDPNSSHHKLPKPKVTWTKDGVMVTGAKTKQTTKPHLSARMQKLVESRKQRVQIYKNGEHRGSGISVIEGSLNNMMRDASNMLYFSVSDLYTIEGTRIIEGEPVPHIITTSHIKGPLWATKGKETFSYVGAYNWCKAQQSSLKSHLKSLRDKLSQGYLEEWNDEKLEDIQKKISDTEDVLRNIGDILVNISDDVFEEKENENEFKVKNMPVIKDKSRLLGESVKINVYINGRETEPKFVVIQMPPRGSFKPSLSWLLCECEKIHADTLGGSTRKATKLYKSSGVEVSNINDLEPDDDVYLSFGERFTKPKVKTYLDTAFVGVTGYKIPDQDEKLLTKRMLEEDETTDSPKMFDVHSGLPDSYKPNTQFMGLKQKNLKMAINDVSSNQIFSDNTLLQHKTYRQRLIYPSVTCTERPISTSQKPGFMKHSQIWVYTSNNQIRLKSFPKLSLVVSDHAVLYTEGEDRREGYMVGLSKNIRQTWQCTVEGNIKCDRTGLLLTFLDNPAELYIPNNLGVGDIPGTNLVRHEVRDSSVGESGSFEIYGKTSYEAVTVPATPRGEDVRLVALPGLQNAELQRWAFKQENISLLGQWKLCDVENPEWSKESLSWPVTRDGALNTELSWPVEGYLMSKAPSTSCRKSKSKTQIFVPLRLKIRNNGSCDAVRLVTAPDLSNMKKDLAMKYKIRDPGGSPDTKKWLNKHSKEIISEEDELKVSDLEFRLFLDKCQSVLGLLTPPTRLFTSDGDELISLESLERDSEVYVSCGAEFIPPDNEKDQRNKIMYDLTRDIDKIKTFCSAIAPINYAASVNEIKRNVQVKLNLLIDPEIPALVDNHSDISKIVETNKSIVDKNIKPSEAKIDDHAFHFKSHTNQNAADISLVEDYPWRNPVFTSGIVKNKHEWEVMNSSVNGSDTESDCESVSSIISNSSVSSLKSRKKGFSFDQWVYKECRFFLLANPQYVLSTDIDNSVQLVLYDKNSAQQCWTIDDDFIYASNGQVLTVTECSVNPPASVDHVGSKLKVAPLQGHHEGNTNQKWRYDSLSGHLTALSGSELCRCINAALLTRICTYAVTGTDNAEQPTYLMENPGLPGIPQDNTHIYLCGSCATSLRDRYTVEKIDSVTFVCSIGYYCSTSNLSLKSSFGALGGLDGLGPGKAFGTLYLLESILMELKEETSISAIRGVIKQTLQLECDNDDLILCRCYVNGKGPPRNPGVIFLARNIQEILCKSLIELKAGRPLSRIFLPDGTEISKFSELMCESDVPYKELFISSGEDFLPVRKKRGWLSAKKRMELYRELNKIDVTSMLNLTSNSTRNQSRPAHLPVGRNKHTIPVQIARNGDYQSQAVRVVAHSLDSLMEQATSRLNMCTAARRVFLSNGTRVKHWEGVERDTLLVISAGETFISKNTVGKKKWIHRKMLET